MARARHRHSSPEPAATIECAAHRAHGLAHEAERIGLVSATVPADQLLPRALEMARSIADHSTFAVWMTKRGGWANVEAPSLQAAIELENRTQILARSTGHLAQAALALVGRHKAKRSSEGPERE